MSDTPDTPNWYLKDDDDKHVSTFIPRVLGLINVVSTTGVKESVQLDLLFSDNQSRKATVLLSEVAQIDWFKIDKRCLVNPHYRKAGEYIANMIRAGLSNVKTETRYCIDKLGIRRVGDNRLVYRAGDRVITWPPAEEADPKRELEPLPFTLDIDKKLTPKEAFKGMNELISLSPEIGRVLVAHTISGITRAAFIDAGITPCAVLIVVGESGMLKSHYVPHMVQLYNRTNEIRAVTRFNSTSRYIEDVLYEYCECTAVIDDLHSAEARSIKRTNETTAEEIIRRISDDTGRGHKEGNALVQKKFRGNVVFIGEYVIGKESTVPRALVVNLTRPPDGSILDKYQRHQPLLVSTFYHYFIEWYVRRYDDICKGIDAELTKQRAATTASDIHGRLRDTQFYLNVSFMLLMEFCKDSGFVTAADARVEYLSFERQLAYLIEAQQARFKASKAEEEQLDYLKLIRRLYKRENFRLADSPETFDPEIHDGLIYYECLCLRGDCLEKRLRRVDKRININDVIRELADRGALKRVQDKRSVKISTLNKDAGALRFYAIWLYELV
ncbi:MAG: hypothetical protein LBS19_08225 [Clostridiales bacterium]|jgi:hypothetical protein|nr:hypothetical protein [Clostridiales bacterium]